MNSACFRRLVALLRICPLVTPREFRIGELASILLVLLFLLTTAFIDSVQNVYILECTMNTSPVRRTSQVLKPLKS